MNIILFIFINLFLIIFLSFFLLIVIIEDVIDQSTNK